MSNGASSKKSRKGGGLDDEAPMDDIVERHITEELDKELEAWRADIAGDVAQGDMRTANYAIRISYVLPPNEHPLHGLPGTRGSAKFLESLEQGTWNLKTIKDRCRDSDCEPAYILVPSAERDSPAVACPRRPELLYKAGIRFEIKAHLKITLKDSLMEMSSMAVLLDSLKKGNATPQETRRLKRRLADAHESIVRRLDELAEEYNF